jgi:benzodiazapine receptor
MAKSDIIRLLASLLFTVGLGSLGGLFTASEIETWYAGLNKPSFNPPSYVFAPVWTVLYILMGISFYLIWKQPVSQVRTAAVLFFLVQFVLNFFWSFIFFNQHMIAGALIEMLFMWLFIAFTINEFRKMSKVAAWLLVPYILWVSFAAVLNFYIWRLNP